MLGIVITMRPECQTTLTTANENATVRGCYEDDDVERSVVAKQQWQRCSKGQGHSEEKER